jgi:hypothetical protein
MLRQNGRTFPSAVKTAFARIAPHRLLSLCSDPQSLCNLSRIFSTEKILPDQEIAAAVLLNGLSPTALSI